MPDKSPVADKIVVEVDEDLSDLVPGFLAHKRDDLRNILDALARNDFDVVNQLAHRLKGEGASYGFAAITEMGRDLERAAKHHDAHAVAVWTNALLGYLDRVEVVYHRAEA
jgi:HPt (histidine-containing phosphotransfer) domain-containing protein